MPNEKNLKPIRSKKRARELGAMGGQKFAENQRRRKSLRENMNLLLSLNVLDTTDLDQLSALGIPSGDIDNAMLLTAALFCKAKTGDVAACKEIREWLGEDAGEDSGVQIVDDV